MIIKNIPEDINVELLLSYLPKGSCKVKFNGLHKRNAYRDIANIKEIDDKLLIEVGRKSLYNALPEYMFHPVDRFDNLRKEQNENKREKLFNEEYDKQKIEKTNAYNFFEPLDLLLLQRRVMVRENLNKYVENNRVLIDIICNNLTEEQKSNRFIKQALNFIPACKYIRGDKTLLTFMLRKIFVEEGLKIEIHPKVESYTDEMPRYCCELDSTLDDSTLENTYLGNSYDELTTIYDVHFWSEEDCDENFHKFIEDIDLFRIFVQDYFISIEETLQFNIYDDKKSLDFSNENTYYYLNYNTNL